MPSAKTHVNKINTVVIPVSDQDPMIAFYVEKLGFQKRTDIPFGNGYRWVEVAPEDAETTIALAPPPQGEPAGNRETDVDAEISRMGDPVPPLFWLRDPEGNSLMVVG
jgi:catechol 2,3-dioxygenase-like lactoylglutathione lyase family enzyme